MLDRYWVGSLDFNFLVAIKRVSTKPQKVKLFAGGPAATKCKPRLKRQRFNEQDLLMTSWAGLLVSFRGDPFLGFLAKETHWAVAQKRYQNAPWH